MSAEGGPRNAELKHRIAHLRDGRKLSSGFYSPTVDEFLELLGICEGILDLVGPQPMDRVWQQKPRSEEAVGVEEKRGANS